MRLGGFKILTHWDTGMSCFYAQLEPYPAIKLSPGVGNSAAQAVESLERNLVAYALTTLSGVEPDAESRELP